MAEDKDLKRLSERALMRSPGGFNDSGGVGRFGFGEVVLWFYSYSVYGNKRKSN